MNYFPVFVNGLEKLEQNIRENTVFIAHDFFGGDANKMSDYRQYYKDGFKPKGITPIFPDMEGIPGHLLKTICVHIMNSPIGIFDISSFNANVLIEYGMALGMNRPSILIAEEAMELPEYLRPLRIHRFANKVKLAKEIPLLIEQYLHESHEDVSGYYCHICGTRCGIWHKELHAPKDYLIMGFGDNDEDDLYYNTSQALNDFNLIQMQSPPRGKLEICQWVSTIRRSRLALFHLPKKHHGAESAAINIQIGIAAGLGTPWTLILRDDANPPTDLQGLLYSRLGNSNTDFRNQLSNAIRGLLNSRVDSRGVFTELDREELLLQEDFFDLTDIETKPIIAVLIVLKDPEQKKVGSYIEFGEADLPYNLWQQSLLGANITLIIAAQIKKEGDELYLQPQSQSIALDEIVISPDNKPLRLYDKAQITINESNIAELRLGKTLSQIKVENFPIPLDDSNVDKLILQAIQAYQSENVKEAESLLIQASVLDEYSELAWLWLSAIVEPREDIITCLENVLAINPQNTLAINILTRMGEAIPQAKEQDNEAITGDITSSQRIDRILETLAEEHAPQLLQSAPIGVERTGYLGKGLAEYGVLLLVAEVSEELVQRWMDYYRSLYTLITSELFPATSEASLRLADALQPTVVYMVADAIPAIKVFADYLVPFVAMKQGQLASDAELHGLITFILEDLEADDLSQEQYTSLLKGSVGFIRQLLGMSMKHYSLTDLKKEIRPINGEYIKPVDTVSQETKPYVFISYSRKDEDIMRRVNDYLKSRGVKTWVDVFDMPVDADWNRQIQVGLMEMDALVLIMSSNALSSKTIMAEVNWAQNNAKPVYILQPNSVNERDIPFRLSIHQYNDISTNFEAGMQRLIEALPDNVKPAKASEPKIQKAKHPKNIFISYARTDGEVWSELVNALHKAEHKVWKDSEATTGEDWRESYERAIRASDVIIYLVSESSSKSTYCHYEYRYAVEQHKPILPVLVERPQELPIGLEAVHFVDKDDVQGLLSFLDSLELKANVDPKLVRTLAKDEFAKRQSAQTKTQVVTKQPKSNVMKIFISYRRSDSDSMAAEITDRLGLTFGKQIIFSNMEDNAVEQDSRNQMINTINESNIMLVLIGPQWLAELNHRRDNDFDFVRREVSLGLRKPTLFVIPVLLEGVEMPSSKELPEDLKDLAMRNAISIRNEPFFARDMVSFITQIEKIRDSIEKLGGSSDEKGLLSRVRKIFGNQ